MKTIGIATHYTNSCNYGGCLQAYALCEVLLGLGFEPKQIRYQNPNRFKISKIFQSLKNGNFIKKSIRKIKEISNVKRKKK